MLSSMSRWRRRRGCTRSSRARIRATIRCTPLEARGRFHAYRVAEILGCPEVIIPFGAGVGSTIGFLVAPVAFDFVRSYVCRLASADWDNINQRLGEMEAEGRAILEEAGVRAERIIFERSAELRYVGQGHDVRVSLPEGRLDESAPSRDRATIR